MKIQSLNGTWKLTKKDSNEVTDATVPGTVHTALLDAGKIPDPYFGMNELDILWIGETDWVYTLEFNADSSVLSEENILLTCNGLDTLATITLNGAEIGKTENMFREYEFDIKEILTEGKNKIAIEFAAPLKYIEQKGQERDLRGVGSVPHEPRSRQYMRKEQCNFGWDWGPVCPTCGIWKDIELTAWSGGRFEDIHIRQEHDNGNVELSVNAGVQGNTEKCTVSVKVSLNGDSVISRENIAVSDGKACFSETIQDPSLWWPAGMGEQPLYAIEVKLAAEDGTELDSDSKRIGLRTLDIHREKDEWGESFYFKANGVPFFSKGSNWIPADTFSDRATPEMYTRLLLDAKEANMNMIRVWGGGIYEMDIFYDLCDELGLCVWQDFMYACGAYPADDPDFMDNVRIETREQVKRIRHHACLALWCGNNELEQFVTRFSEPVDWPRMPKEYYTALFDKLIPEEVGKHDPDTTYWPSSPHSPHGNRDDHSNPDWGDAHTWAVWHGRQPFEWYRTSFHRFNSEFGFQSFPEPKTTHAYTAPQDRNITSKVMEFHQRSHQGNSKIIDYLLSWFPLPHGFDNTLWMTHILQGLGVKYAVEHWRQNMPRCMGALYWQINDCWPVASWASIDWYGRWKALHYMAKRFFAPMMISGVENEEEETVEIHIANDLLEDKKCTVVWTASTSEGKTIKDGTIDITCQANSSTKAETLDLSAVLAEQGPENVLVWLELEHDGNTVSHNFVTFRRPKHMNMAEPVFSVEVTGENTDFTISLECDKAALWTFVDMPEFDGKLSDSFFCLRPNRKIELTLKTEKELTLEQVKNGINVRSLYDLFEHAEQ